MALSSGPGLPSEMVSSWLSGAGLSSEMVLLRRIPPSGAELLNGMTSSSGPGLSGEMALPSGMVLLQLTPPSRTKLLNRIKLPNRVNSKYGR